MTDDELLKLLQALQWEVRQCRSETAELKKYFVRWMVRTQGPDGLDVLTRGRDRS